MYRTCGLPLEAVSSGWARVGFSEATLAPWPTAPSVAAGTVVICRVTRLVSAAVACVLFEAEAEFELAFFQTMRPTTMAITPRTLPLARYRRRRASARRAAACCAAIRCLAFICRIRSALPMLPRLVCVNWGSFSACVARPGRAPHGAAPGGSRRRVGTAAHARTTRPVRPHLL